MKKNFLILLLAVFCFACSNNQSSSAEKKVTTTAENPDIEKGLNLVAKSDCFGCHKITEPSVGPAYNLVAQKYEGTETNINMLAEKLMKGGSGNWGQVPMAAHPNVSKEDALLMAKYVLSLKDVK